MVRSAVAVLILACALTSCSSGAGGPEAADSPTTSESPTPAAPTELTFGDTESVAWSPASDLTGELSISVEKVREGDFADFEALTGSGITENNQPFYVEAVIANDGDADFGGLDVPLYLQDSNGTLSPPWGFVKPFEPCDSGPLPDSFGAGEEAELCLVFFGSPDATFESVTYQPTQDSVAVTWTGDLTVEKKPVEKEPTKKRTEQKRR